MTANLIAEVLAQHEVAVDLERRFGAVKANGRVPRLRRPDGTDPDRFYCAVAQAYAEVAPATHRPATLLAEAADVPVVTVHRWVREARRRGHLPPAHQGRASSAWSWRCYCGAGGRPNLAERDAAVSDAARHQAERVWEALVHGAPEVVAADRLVGAGEPGSPQGGGEK